MRRLIGSMMLMLVTTGCANQLALSELSARNTVPPPGTQNRLPSGGNGYYNPLSYFQPNSANANPTPFTPPAPNQGLATAPNVGASSSNGETTSPFWNLPSAAANTPAPPPADRWASRGAGAGANFGGNVSGFNSVPSRGASNFGTSNFGNSNSGNSGFGSNGFGNSGYQNRGPVSFGGNPAPANPAGTSTNPLGDLFTKLFGAAPANRASGLGSVNNWSQPAPNANGFAARPNPAPQTPAPRFDFGAPRTPTGASEPAIKISDSALRELPRNPRGVSTTPSTASAAPSVPPLARQPAAPLNNLPAAPPPARPLPQQDSEYIEITRLPMARAAT
jgi:hypothetical protein